MLGEQESLDDISSIATEALSKRSEKDFQPGDIEDDWLYQFEGAAKGFSSDHMKQTFGRILAGEILKPGSYSPATLRTLTTLDQRAAQLMRRYASLAWTATSMNPRVLDLGKAIGGNGLTEYGMSYNDASHLRECGLVALDLSSWQEADLYVLSKLPLSIGGRRYRVETDQRTPGMTKRFSGLALTGVGAQLLTVVEPFDTPEKYVTDLRQYLASTFSLVLVGPFPEIDGSPEA